MRRSPVRAPKLRLRWLFGGSQLAELARTRDLPKRLFELRDEDSCLLGLLAVTLGFFDPLHQGATDYRRVGKTGDPSRLLRRRDAEADAHGKRSGSAHPGDLRTQGIVEGTARAGHARHRNIVNETSACAANQLNPIGAAIGETKKSSPIRRVGPAFNSPLSSGGRSTHSTPSAPDAAAWWANRSRPKRKNGLK